MWGTQYNWVKAALHFGIEDENPKQKLVEYLDSHPEDQAYGKTILEENGIWEQANQIAKELDLKIQ